MEIENEFNKGESLGYEVIKQNNISFFLNPTTPDQIYSVIKKICTKRRFGNDEVPGYILKEIAEKISTFLSLLINFSYSQGIYPALLK